MTSKFLKKLRSKTVSWLMRPSANSRAKRVMLAADRKYLQIVLSCQRVSAVNKSLAFAVHRVGVFGGPVIEQIDRPKVVSLTENDRCVIVRDGYVYELTRRA